MEEKMLSWKNYIEENINKEIDVDLDIIRVSIIAINNKNISEYFTFDNKEILIDFLIEVVLPSVTLSMFFEDSKDPSLYLWNKEEVIEFLEDNSTLLNRRFITLYKNSYEYLNQLKESNVDKFIIEKAVKYLEKSFDAYNLVFLNLYYGESTDEYLKNIIKDYKDKKILELLDKDLKLVDLSVEKLNSVINEIYDYEKGIREGILDKIPAEI